MAKEKKPVTAKETKHVEFTMETSHFHPRTSRRTKGEPIDIVAPEDSLDKEGNAESALSGTYRYA